MSKTKNNRKVFGTHGFYSL